MKLSFPVQRQSDTTFVPRVDEALPRLLCLFERERPLAVQLQDLGAVNETSTRECQHVRLPVAPSRQSGSPLSRAPHLVYLLTGQDHAAIDDARRDRRELARRDSHHGLVEESESLLYPSRLDQHGSLTVSRERESVRIAESLGNGSRLGGDGRARLEVAGRLVLVRERHEEIAALDEIAWLAFEKALCPGDPTAAWAHFASNEESQADPDGVPDCRQRLARLEVRVMCALQEREVLVVSAEHECRRGEQLEILAPERLGLVGRRKVLVGLAPCPACVGLAAELDTG